MRSIAILVSVLAALDARADTCPGTAPVPPATPSLTRQILQDRLNDGIGAIAWSPDGTYIGATTGARSARIWHAAHHTVLATIRRPEMLPPWSIEFTTEANRVIVGQTDSRVVDVARDVDVAAFNHSGSRAGQHARRIPGNTATPYVGAVYNDLWLFDAKLVATTKLAWPPALAAYIRGLAVSADGKTLVAATGSKGVFAWTLATPAQAPRAFALPPGLNAEDVAVSADGKLAYIAAQAPSGTSGKVLALSLGDGKVVREFTVPRYVKVDAPSKVTLSHDGKLLAAGSLHALSVWNTGTGALAWELEAGSAAVRGQTFFGQIFQAVAFSPKSSLLAAGNANGNLFLFDGATGRQLADLGMPVRRPFVLGFTDPSTLVAVAQTSVTRWSIGADPRRIDAHGAVAPSAITAQPGGDVAVARMPITWSNGPCPNGNPLYVESVAMLEASHAASGTTRGFALGKPAAPAPALATAPLPTTTQAMCIDGAFEVSAIHAAAARAIVDSRTNGGLAVIQLADGKRTPLDRSDGYLFARAFSADGARVVAGDLQHAGVWDAKTGKLLGTFSADANGAQLAALASDGTQIAVFGFSAFGGGLLAVFDVASSKKLWQVPIALVVPAIAFRGTSHDLIVTTNTGFLGVLHEGKLAFEVPSQGVPIMALASSPDGKLAATTHQDGGLRLWDLDARSVRATLVDFEDDEWAMITPAGAFDGTSEVASRIGWAFDAPLEYFGFEQFAQTYRQPDIVKRRVRGEAIDVTAQLSRPPVASIAAATASKSRATIRVKATSGSRIDTVWLFREGRPLEHKPLCKADGEVAFDVPLLSGINHLEATAVDDRGFSSNAATVELVGSASGAKPELWVLAIGVSKYPNLAPGEQLAVAHADATAIAAAFSSQIGAGKPFSSGHIATLTDEQVTVDAVRAALKQLEAMKPDDLAVVFMAGHGIKLATNREMRFLTHETALTAASIEKFGIGWSEISGSIDRMRGRVLLLLDACHSGHLTQDVVVPNGALANALAKSGRSGVIVFAASKGRQDSLETGAHGVFTQAFLDVLAARDTDHDRDGAIQISEVLDAVTLRVEQVTNGLQSPWVARREIFGDFQIAASAKP